MKTEKRQAEKAGMNILGDLPLDFAGTDFMERFRMQVQELGIQIRASLFDRADMSQIDQIFSARWNTAVSYSGALLGAWLCRTQNMPCVTGFSMSAATVEHWRAFAQEHADHDVVAWGTQEELCGQKDGILILGDRIIANSLGGDLLRDREMQLCRASVWSAGREPWSRQSDEKRGADSKQSMIPRLPS